MLGAFPYAFRISASFESGIINKRSCSNKRPCSHITRLINITALQKQWYSSEFLNFYLRVSA